MPIYKKVKRLMPHCPKCGEMLGGNNSIMIPWHCKCGDWGYKTKDETLGEYEIINN